MPGAIQAMARAVGMDMPTFFKAMEDGKLKAEDVLPKFSEELMKMANEAGALEKATNNTAAAIGRFKTNVWLANKTFNEAGYDKAVRDFFNTSSDAIMKAEPLWILMGQASEYLGKAIETPIELFGELASKLGVFTEEGYEASQELKQMTAAAILFFAPLRKLFAIFYLLPASIAAVTDTLDEGFDSWEDFFEKMGVWSLTAAALLTSLKGIRTVLGAAAFQALLKRSIAPVGIDSVQSEESILKMMNDSAARRDHLFTGDMQNDAAKWFSSIWSKLTGESGGIGADFDYSIMSESFGKSFGISKADAATQHIGDLYITVQSPDPNLAGTVLEETYRNLFNMELRTASVSQQITEK